MRPALASLLQPGVGRGIGLAIALLFVVLRGSMRGWRRRQRRRAAENRDVFGRPRLGELAERSPEEHQPEGRR